MPEMYLRQPGFTYSVLGVFTKNKERIQKFKETGDSRYLYQNELNKACFQHDLAYGYFKYLARRTASDRIFSGKAFNIAKNLKYDGYQKGLASMVYNFFDKKTSGAAIENEIIPNKELAEELHKQIIRKSIKGKVQSSFIDNIWGTDLEDMHLISKLNKGFRFLLCVIDNFSKYAWVVPLKDKKGIVITNAFQKNLNESNSKPNKIWVNKCRKFCNRSLKS